MTAAATDVDGVRSISIDRPAGRATLEYDDKLTDPKAVAEAISKAGFETGVMQIANAELSITGMTCGGCEKKVTAAATELEGVHAITIDRPAGRATINYDADKIAPTAVAKAITDAGFDAKVEDEAVTEEPPAEPETQAPADAHNHDATAETPACPLPRPGDHEAVEAAAEGVESSDATAAIAIDGMTCMGCVATVTKAINKMPGVTGIDINLARGRATLGYDPHQTDPAAVATAITAAGYPAHQEHGDDPSLQAAAEAERAAHRHEHATTWKRRAIVGLCLWAPLELTHWTLMAFGYHEMGLGVIGWISVFVGTFLTVFIGSAFFKSAIDAAKRGATNMDTLIALGGGTAFVYSVVALVGHLALGWNVEHFYFMEAAGLFTLISLGHWLEAAARDRAGSAIRALLDLSPPTAIRIDNGTETEVAASDLAVGDRIRIKPASRVPADGEIEEGRGAVDESMLTGEPLPVAKQPGDDVIGGTVNAEGSLVVRVTKSGADSTLAGIVKLVEQAQSSKPPVQKLADQISAIFVPSVLGIALLTAIVYLCLGYFAPHLIPSWLWSEGQTDWTHADIWGMTARSTCAVLIIACPCALGLAVPAALMVGTGRGAKRGILLRDIDALQHARDIDTIVFDKTGTLTTGEPKVTSVEPAEGVGEDDLLRLAAAAESHSEHPLAAAIVEHAKSRGIDLPQASDFRNEPGLGVEATVDNQTLRVGHASFTGHGSDAPAASTAVEVVADDKHLGRIVLADETKEGAADVVRELRDLGLQVHMLTGDNAASAKVVAEKLGIDAKNVHADVRPEGKKAVIEGLRNATDRGQVAMVGDGVNDAPALAAADLGIAMGTGTDAAKQAGGLVLVAGRLADLPVALRLSRQTMKVVKQNLFWAFAYNVVAIPIAAMGFLNPMIAAGAMALSDVTVLGNALRLRKVEIDRS